LKYGIVVSVSKTKFGPIVFKENLYENLIKAKELGVMNKAIKSK